MAKRKKRAGPLPTIWRVDDALWAQAEKVLEEHDPPARFGPGRIDQPDGGPVARVGMVSRRLNGYPPR